MKRALLVGTLVLAGCGAGVVGPVEDDAGELPVVDAGVEEEDAGETEWEWDGGFDEEDAGLELDAGEELDAGLDLDAGLPDAGRLGAGLPDAGRPDAGRPDAGTPDAGRPDSGVVSDAGLSSTRHTMRPIGSHDAGNGYWEYLPPGYGDGTDRPLLVFWHGIDENGDGGLADLPKVARNGPPRLINQNQWPNARPFVVLSPQHRGTGCPSASEIRNFITYAARQYDVDPRRLYLTALSCGAIGSWNYIGVNLDSQIAGAVLIAGDPGKVDAGTSAWGRNQCNLGRVPIWSFHGDADTRVRIANNRDTMTNLIACPQPREDERFTVYPGVGHDSWTRTYNLDAGHDIYSWLLMQVK
jgi:predicted esterase